MVQPKLQDVINYLKANPKLLLDEKNSFTAEQ